MHLKIYTGTLKKRPIFTVYWRVGEKPFRKLFADPIKAEDFAKAQAEQLAAGQVYAPVISITDAQTFREAQRRLGPVNVPLHVAAGDYSDLMQQLGENGTVRQAIEFFLHNAVRPDLVRTVSQVVEEFVATKAADGLSQVYLDDCAWRLRTFATDFQTPISHVCTRDIEDWLRKLSTGLATRNNYRRLIITLFNFARRRGYALFNALNVFASRPPGLRDFRRAEHSMQAQAGRWLREFDELLQTNPQPDLAEYLGQYGEVAGWN